MHGKLHQKALSNVDSRKGTGETPIDSTQPGQSTTKE
jgi:hypothetical protein